MSGLIQEWRDGRTDGGRPNEGSVFALPPSSPPPGPQTDHAQNERERETDNNSRSVRPDIHRWPLLLSQR